MDRYIGKSKIKRFIFPFIRNLTSYVTNNYFVIYITISVKAKNNKLTER